MQQTPKNANVFTHRERVYSIQVGSCERRGRFEGLAQGLVSGVYLDRAVCGLGVRVPVQHLSFRAQGFGYRAAGAHGSWFLVPGFWPQISGFGCRGSARNQEPETRNRLSGVVVRVSGAPVLSVGRVVEVELVYQPQVAERPCTVLRFRLYIYIYIYGV